MVRTWFSRMTHNDLAWYIVTSNSRNMSPLVRFGVSTTISSHDVSGKIKLRHSRKVYDSGKRIILWMHCTSQLQDCILCFSSDFPVPLCFRWSFCFISDLRIYMLITPEEPAKEKGPMWNLSVHFIDITKVCSTLSNKTFSIPNTCTDRNILKQQI